MKMKHIEDSFLVKVCIWMITICDFLHVSSECEDILYPVSYGDEEPDPLTSCDLRTALLQDFMGVLLGIFAILALSMGMVILLVKFWAIVIILLLVISIIFLFYRLNKISGPSTTVNAAKIFIRDIKEEFSDKFCTLYVRTTPVTSTKKETKDV